MLSQLFGGLNIVFSLQCTQPMADCSSVTCIRFSTDDMLLPLFTNLNISFNMAGHQLIGAPLLKSTLFPELRTKDVLDSACFDTEASTLRAVN